MARDGNGVYTLPAGSAVANGDLSDASDVNVPFTDLETDANAARPVVAGGTGATTAAAARVNLGLEIDVDVQGYSRDVNAITSSRSLALTDEDDIGDVDTSGGNIVVTIDPNSTTACPVPFITHMIQTDATNSFTITGGTGVTVNGVSAGSGVVVASAGSEISIMQIATDTWWVVGDIGTFA